MISENPQQKQQTWLSHLEGYILIPHELLHVVGYRLVGKSCHYCWGDRSVRPIGSVSQQQRLVGLLFPFIIFAASFLICALASGIAYAFLLSAGSWAWFIVWTTLALILGIYVGTTITDLRQAYLLLAKKPWYAWTPFDLFFWPFVDWKNVRKRALEKLKDDQ